MSMAQVQILRAACCVAGIDGNVAPEELPLLQRLAQAAGVGGASFKAMLEQAQGDPNFYQQQFRVLKTDPEVTMKVLFAIAMADCRLREEERVILRYFADQLGMSPERFDQYLAAAEARLPIELSEDRPQSTP